MRRTEPVDPRARRIGTAMALGAAVLFSMKAVLVKIGLAHGVPSTDMLMMRMALAAPIFAVVASRPGPQPLTRVDLARLFALASRVTTRFAAMEPRRSFAGLLGVAALPLMDANPVTRHDARVSVQAGFRNRELSALWPRDGWRCEERRAFPFSHWFCARRE